MSTEFDKRYIADFGQKLAHLEGILGAYLPRHVFESEAQQNLIDCNKFTYSRLRIGQRKAANWELAQFIELFDLARHGFDYLLFLEPFEDFEASLAQAGVGSHGVTARERLRETLRAEVPEAAKITLHLGWRLNVGGIGQTEDGPGLMCLTARDSVTLNVPLRPSTTGSSYLLLLHDFPAARATSCLMPSVFAPERAVSGVSLRLPQAASGYLSFPVGGQSGYRCLYGLQSPTDVADFIGLEKTDEGVVDIQSHQIALLVDYLSNVAPAERAQTQVSFAEYLLK